MPYLIRFFLSVSLGIFSSLAACQTYTWDSKKNDFGDGIPRAILINGTVLEFSKKSASSFEDSVTGVSLDNKQTATLAQNNYVAIAAAFPNTRQAAAVVLFDECSGTACSTPTVTVVIPEGDFLKSYPLVSPSKIYLTFTSGVLTSGRAEGIPVGKDEYGTTILSTLSYLPKAGFVATGFKREYAKLVGKHPDDFYADENLRRPFVKAVGLEKFRELRTASGVASPSVLVQGRYLVLHGCTPHMCGGNHAMVLIDAVTSEFYWSSYDGPSKIYAGSTKPVDKARMSALLSDKKFPSFGGDVELVVTAQKTISFATKRPK